LDQMGAQFEFLKVEDASERFTGVGNVENHRHWPATQSPGRRVWFSN
jgi:hypothetical protein